MKWLSFSFIALSIESAFACPKFFQKHVIPNSGYESEIFSLSENRFGVTFNGLRAEPVNGRALFFHPRAKRWCIEVAPEKADCSISNRAGASENYLAIRGKTGSVIAVATIDHNQINITANDPDRPFDPESPLRTKLRNKPMLRISANLENEASGQLRSGLKLEVVDIKESKVLGRSQHEVVGQLSDEGMLKRSTPRSFAPPDPVAEARAASAVSLIGKAFAGPEKCGSGTVADFNPTDDISETRAIKK